MFSKKNHFEWVAIFALILVCSVYSIQPVNAVQYANLYVHVTDCDTGEQLQNVRIVADGEDYRTEYTDSSGVALFSRLRLIPGGTERYDLTLSKSGYHTKSTTTYVSCSQTHHIYVCLDRDIICGVDVNSVYAREGQISATVRNTGNARESITVNFYVGSSVAGTTAVSLAAGASTSVTQPYDFDCGTNNVRVVATADCGSTDEDSTTYTNPCNCQLIINVVDQDEKSLDANIYIDGTYRRYSDTYSTEIDSGTYIVSAKRTDYDSAQETVVCNDDETIRTELVLEKQSCVIEVHVKDMMNEAIDLALVELGNEDKLTESNGIAEYEDLTPGSYRISASKDGYSSASTTATCECGETKVVELFLEEQAGALKVHVSECTTGNAIEGADVDVIENVHEEGYTNEYGYAYFSGLPSGSYEVSAKMDGYESNYKNNVRVYEDRMTVVDVCLKEEHDPETDEECSLRIHVRDEDDLSVNARIYIDGRYKTQSDFYRAELEPDVYEVKASASDYETAIENIECVGGQTQDVYLTLENEGSSSNDDECTLKIYVEDEDGDDLKANIYIDGDYEDYDDYLELEVDEGSHTVKATKSGYDSDSETVTCRDGDTETVYLELDDDEDGDEDECEIKVYVRDEDHDPLDARIYLDDDYEGYYDYKRFVVDEGKHEIWVQRSGYESDSEDFYCDDGEDETFYFFLEEDRYGNSEDLIEITDIILDPENPTQGEMLRGNVYLELTDDDGEDERVYVKITLDGETIKSSSTSFDYVGQEKIITFSVDTWDYSVGQHTIRVEAEIDSDETVETETFQIYSSSGSTPTHTTGHCLRITEVELTNEQVTVGETAEFKVTVENCGDYTESGVGLKLENSDVQFVSSFTLSKGAEREFTFKQVVTGAEDLTFTAWNTYSSDSMTYELVPESGHLAIYLDSSYKIETLQDNKIEFKVKNIGKVEDTFKLEVSDNIETWVYGLSDTITLQSGEETTLEMFVNPGSSTGTFDFSIIAESSGSEKTVSSQLRVVEPWTFPTGVFSAAFSNLMPWLWWLLVLILLILLLLLLWWLFRKLRGRFQERKATSKKRPKDKLKNDKTKNTEMVDYGEETTRRGEPIPMSESKPKSRCGKRFWWDKDCVDDQEVKPSKRRAFASFSAKNDAPKQDAEGRSMDELWSSLRRL